MSSEGDIHLDNEIYIQSCLTAMGMEECKPTLTPITDEVIKNLYRNLKEGRKQTDEDQASTMKLLGQAMWINQTTHPVIATAVSMLSSLVKSQVEGALEAMKHLFAYLQRVKKKSLTKKRGVRTGFRASSDADWAGLHSKSLGQELRSRTGTLVTYDDMPVAWKSYFQKVTGTSRDSKVEYDEDLIATSSADSETHAAGDSARVALHLANICDEIDIKVPKPLVMMMDAQASRDFIEATGTSTRMKHIDLREAWICNLRSTLHSKQMIIEWEAGELNESDFLTKITTGEKFRKRQDKLMGDLPETS